MNLGEPFYYPNMMYPVMPNPNYNPNNNCINNLNNRITILEQKVNILEKKLKQLNKDTNQDNTFCQYETSMQMM